jgi:hypothetical protein
VGGHRVSQSIGEACDLGFQCDTALKVIHSAPRLPGGLRPTESSTGMDGHRTHYFGRGSSDLPECKHDPPLVFWGMFVGINPRRLRSWRDWH